ncbi:hypothetical protein BASA81_000064 [Batrachochytrium salamandrivorans]|nr:hypothetical protein BASA81_000064 [Batrachochytrium salamandrivorans]
MFSPSSRTSLYKRIAAAVSPPDLENQRGNDESNLSATSYPSTLLFREAHADGGENEKGEESEEEWRIENHAPMSSLVRRKSSLAQAFARATSSSATAPAQSKEMHRMAQAIELHRKALIHSLVKHPGNVVVQIRFVAAVDQYLQTKSRVERETLGKNICRLFVNGRDLFKVQDLSREVLAQLQRNRIEYLEDARRDVLSALCRDQHLLAAVELAVCDLV